MYTHIRYTDVYNIYLLRYAHFYNIWVCLTHTISLTRAHTSFVSHSCTHTHTHTHWLTHTLLLSLAILHTHTHTHSFTKQSLSHSITHCNGLLALSLTDIVSFWIIVSSLSSKKKLYIYLIYIHTHINMCVHIYNLIV